MTPPEHRRVYWSSTSEPTAWATAGDWIDHRVLRCWLRHPVLTFKWWRQDPRLYGDFFDGGA